MSCETYLNRHQSGDVLRRARRISTYTSQVTSYVVLERISTDTSQVMYYVVLDVAVFSVLGEIVIEAVRLKTSFEFG